MVVCLSIDIDW